VALIKCPDFGKNVSNQAKACPFCGCPIGSAAWDFCPFGFIVGKIFANLELLGINRYFPYYQAFFQRGKSHKSPLIATFFAKLVYDLVYWCILLYDDECSVQANDQIENCFSKYFSNCFRLSSLFPPIQRT
jgi:hypothetical protein